MANLTESLLKAIAIIADKSIEEVSSDKTIKAVIKKVVSTSEGKYLVTYNGGDFYVYTQSGSTSLYQVDEQIYVLVPGGDFSQKKFIVGKVEEEKELILLDNSNIPLLSDYAALGGNAVYEEKYGRTSVKKMQPLALNSHNVSSFYYCYLRDPSTVPELPEENGKPIYNTLKYPAISIDEEVFSNDAKQAEALLIRAKFKSNLDVSNIGNYGIIVNIAFADETNPQEDGSGNITYPPKLIAYVFDTSKMTGDPMKYYDYTSQYMVAPFDGEKYLYVDSIVAFSEGFVNENVESHGENDDINIYIDNFELVALSEISAVNGDYKLKLSTPKGSTIREGERNSLEVIATMTSANQDITKNTDFYWGIKDPLVTSFSKDYSVKLGSGYRYLRNDNTNKIILSSLDLSAAENTLLCVANYESSIILKAFINIYNNNNKIKVSIESDSGTVFQFNEGKPTLTCLINDKEQHYQTGYSDDIFSFVWSKEDEEFGSIVLDETESTLEAKKERELQECNQASTGVNSAGRTAPEVSSYYSIKKAQVKDVVYLDGVHGPKIQCRIKGTNIYTTYFCSVYRGGVHVGTGSITLQNSKTVVNNNYYITITNGSQVFQYDESGVAPNSEKQKDPITISDLIAVFHSPQGDTVTPKKVRWIVPKENTLIDLPSLGLETDTKTGEKFFSGDTFPLAIKAIYDNSCNNNQLIAVVTHADGTEYRQTTNLLFTKIGEYGTNGTGTVVKIDEVVNLPEDECLTIIVQGNNVFYNDGTPNNSAILTANLYTNNTPVLGHTTTWTIAGTSGVQSRHYTVATDNGACVISYAAGDNTKLDTRIVEARTTLKGKSFYDFYGIPTIEYTDGYSYENYKIKIMKDKTLQRVLYNSNGENPSYDTNQGVHVELPGWSKTGYINWHVESGAVTTRGLAQSYENPNLLLARTPKSKTGSRILEAKSGTENAQALIINASDVGEACVKKASGIIKNYIKEFLADVESIGADNLMSTASKLESLWNRAYSFLINVPDQSNVYVKTVYQEYKVLIEKMTEEYRSCQDANKKSTEIYDKVQSIWSGEWPTVITKDLLDTQEEQSGIKSIQQLIDRYQKAYDDRSNTESDAISFPVRSNIFNIGDEGVMINLLNDYDDDYNSYLQESGANTTQVDPDLVEYSKVLIAYIYLLINETQKCFEGEYFYGSDSVNLFQEIKQKYSLIRDDWVGENRKIGQNIYDTVSSVNEIAGVYDNVRELYKYYQTMYQGVKKYQIVEDSWTLNTWNAILNGEDPDLLKQIYVIPNESFNGLYLNNNVVGEVFIRNDDDEDEKVAKIYVPIIMTLNSYELSFLNGWDGTNVQVGDDYITTPQIGAGIKDEKTNLFTGMVMGAIENLDGSSEKKSGRKVGLLGYSNGQQSVFIDSETGKVCLGLPEDDDKTNEGRIELVPGGVSKIGNWKIGNRFLYNIVDGTYENRTDKDSRSSLFNKKIMVPHNKKGIILSSDQPYIHIKGAVYDSLKGINYNDEYNDINLGDSLELRLDPGNKSLFSIVQHTVGFGNEENDELLFGYSISGSDNPIKVVKDYNSNGNIGLDTEAGEGIEYLIYILTKDSDQKYQAYYTLQDGTGFDKVAGAWGQSPGIGEAFWDIGWWNFYTETMSLKDSLNKDNFEKTAGDNPIFRIDSETGKITYMPQNLVWDNGVIGVSNEEGWSAELEESSDDDVTIKMEYNKNINIPNIQTYKIGKIINNTDYSIYRASFDYNMTYKWNNISSAEAFMQFYIVSNENDDISKASLKSVQINIWNFSEDAQKIDLFSYNDGSMLKDHSYCLKMDISINSCLVSSNSSYTVKNTSTSFKRPLDLPRYGVLEITEAVQGVVSFATTVSSEESAIAGSYEIYTQNNEKRFHFETNGLQGCDFIVWRKGNSTVTGGGRVFSDGFVKFFTNEETQKDDAKDYVVLSDSPSSKNPWYISFYEEGYCITEKISRTVKTTEEEEDGISNEEIVDTITYILQDVPLEDAEVFEFDWLSSSSYNSVKAYWGLEIVDASFNNMKGFTPRDITKLCVQGDQLGEGVQGTLLSKTYWEDSGEESVQKIFFSRDYYNWVNDLERKKSQYGFINITTDSFSSNSAVYYKYIETLTGSIVNKWFTDTNLPNGFSGGEKQPETGVRSWIAMERNNKEINKALNWKEFIRVGLDENGRFFTAGVQDQKTFSRTGKLRAFGKVTNIYGQEIRINNVSIMKTFAQQGKNNIPDTTYFTRGEKDSGNISIRTSDKGYVELAASDSNTYEEKTNDGGIISLIPTPASYVRVKNNGILIQSGTTYINPTSKSVLKIGVKDEGTETGAKDKVTTTFSLDGIAYSVPAGKIQTHTPEYIVSSSSNKFGKIEDTHFTIQASRIEKVDLAASKTAYDSKIMIGVGGPNLSISHKRAQWSKSEKILSDDKKMRLEFSRDRYIEFNSNPDIRVAEWAVGNMRLQFNVPTPKEDGSETFDSQSVALGFGPRKGSFLSYLSIQRDKVLLCCGGFKGGFLDIQDDIQVRKGKLIVTAGNTDLYKNLNVRGAAYIYSDLSVGKQIGYKIPNNENNTRLGKIHLYTNYKGDKVVLSGIYLKQLFDWYNKTRWAMGCSGNTVWFQNLGNLNNPEGTPPSSSNSEYKWNYKTFSGYDS